MKIYVDVLFINMRKDTFLIELEENSSFFTAKKKLQETSYVYPEEQIWFCDNVVIKNNKIEWNEKSFYSVIVNNKWYSFDIKTITNTTINLNYITSQDTISILKYHIYEKTNLSPNSYKLTFVRDNKVITLEDHDIIGKYFIPNNSTINLTIKLNSGLI